MTLARTLYCALAVSAVSFFGSSTTANAQVDYFPITKTYKVEVQYWFFDTDYYYWSTKLETENRAEAEFLYELLLWAKENGQLNAAAPNSYWRYIAVDVRMVTVYDWNMLLEPVWQSNLEWFGPNLFND